MGNQAVHKSLSVHHSVCQNGYKHLCLSSVIHSLSPKTSVTLNVKMSLYFIIEFLLIVVFQNWKTRWFTLNRNELKYYKDKMVSQHSFVCFFKFQAGYV